MTDMYCSNNRTRLQPCKESIKDDTRFFRYDINNATINSNHNTPILITRHNVTPGMVLVSYFYRIEIRIKNNWYSLNLILLYRFTKAAI